MTIQTEAKRVKMGQSLTSFDTQATNTINALKGIRTNLVAMKTSVNGDADFAAADESEVDVIIAKIDSAIDGITKA